MCNMNTKHHLNILMDKLHLVSLNNVLGNMSRIPFQLPCLSHEWILLRKSVKLAKTVLLLFPINRSHTHD